ncbi:carboxypeptidase B-like [Rhinatrema bivittatum]|uniref:carboxypeptidase B-like n=1 Tax=Rhinatrema bivittatum TaxID=194408 RepID=UPI001128B20E|nr:carboxypeptidase B-like [Rhinatrema bivittatum]
MWVIVLLLGTAAAAAAEPHSFHGEKVFRVIPRNEEEVEFIKSLASNIQVDFWFPESVTQIRPALRVDFRVEFHQALDVQSLLAQKRMKYEILIDNLQLALEKELDNNARAIGYNYEKYNNWESIAEWTASIAAANPALVSRSQIGTTYEGRPMYLLKVGKSGPNKNAIFMDCGFHAREWISHAFCQWFVKEAVNSYGTDEQITNLLNNLDFYILPVLNIDGYVYTWTNNRMWRKTRSKNANSNCIGTDPNRNFNAGWCTVGASNRPCDDTYCGSAPESENETKALADFIRSKRSTIKAYLTIHSYSQMLLFPYSYKSSLTKDHTELNNLAKAAVGQLTSLYSTRYTYGSGAATIYLAAGGSDDWAYDMGVKYSFTFELRDTGRYGFVLPESQIKPTCEETFLAVKYIANYVLNNPY